MNIVSMTLSEAEKFLKFHERHYKTTAQAIWAIGLGDSGQIHGAVILGHREDGDAELSHIYSDGESHGYTLLYGAAWRAAKALGYKRMIL